MDSFLAWQVQRETSLLLRQTSFLEHLNERLGSQASQIVRDILLSSDIPDDNVWLASVREALGSQELFEEVSLRLFTFYRSLIDFVGFVSETSSIKIYISRYVLEH